MDPRLVIKSIQNQQALLEQLLELFVSLSKKAIDEAAGA